MCRWFLPQPNPDMTMTIPFVPLSVSHFGSRVPVIRKASLVAVAGFALWDGSGITAAATPPLVIAGSDLAITGDLGPFTAAWQVQYPETSLMLATLTLSAPQAATPPPLTVTWKFPAIDLAGIWVSDNTKANNDNGVVIESRAVLRAPLLMLLGPDDGNRLTVALSDALLPLKINCGVKEEDVNLYAEAKLFSGKPPPRSSITRSPSA